MSQPASTTQSTRAKLFATTHHCPLMMLTVVYGGPVVATVSRVVVGLGLDTSIESLALQYLATVQALAYGTKHIIDALEQAGHPPISAIYVSGARGAYCAGPGSRTWCSQGSSVVSSMAVVVACRRAVQEPPFRAGACRRARPQAHPAQGAWSDRHEGAAVLWVTTDD